MLNPGRISTRSGMLEMIERMAPSKACQRAMREKQPRVLGGFNKIPPFDLPGWICSVRSRHGRTWHLALMVDEVRHTYTCREVDEIPWINWIGRRDRKGWNPYDGDAPQESAYECRKSVLLGWIDPVCNRNDPQYDPRNEE